LRAFYLIDYVTGFSKDAPLLAGGDDIFLSRMLIAEIRGRGIMKGDDNIIYKIL